jgi:uncharacterized membrane protein (UPF0127 family)
MMNRRHAKTATVALATLIAGCSSYKPPDNLPTVPMQLGTKRFTLEIARNDASRQKGLMLRDSMPRDWGMIFVFPDERELDFWMKNTRYPLDILYVAADGKIVSIHRMEPYDLNTTASEGAAKYAIELNAGQAETTGLKKGDVLSIPPEAKETAQ